MANFNNPYLPYSQNCGQFNPMTMAPFTMQPQSSEIRWVQGENAAKAYPVLPGQSMVLMDSEESYFYIKTTNFNGVPAPIRKFKYDEVTEGAETAKVEEKPNYITVEELNEHLEKFKSEITANIEQIKNYRPRYDKKGGQRNGESAL